MFLNLSLSEYLLSWDFSYFLIMAYGTCFVLLTDYERILRLDSDIRRLGVVKLGSGWEGDLWVLMGGIIGKIYLFYSIEFI